METAVRETGRRRGSGTYMQWKMGEGIPEYTGSYADLRSAEVAPWARFGQRGAFVSLSDQQRGDGYVMEIAPGGQTKIQHHLFEVSLYVVAGRGATTFWQQGSDRKQTLEWQAGSVFSPPLNCFYQHFNLDGTEPTRLFGLGNAPQVMDLFRNPEFVFDTPYAFLDRYGVEENYFAGTGQHLGWRQWRTNFIPDIRAFELDDYKERGAGGTNMHFALANNAMGGHVSEFPPGTFKKAHRHGHGPHVIIVEGTGYSLFWFEGEPRRKVEWHDGMVLVPQASEFHQHFNTGAGYARYLVFGMGGGGNAVTEGDRPLVQSTISTREGGDQIDYEDADPAIYDEFADECRRHGATLVLPRPIYRTD